MSYRVTFAEKELHDYCTILGVKRSILPPRENFSKNIPSMNGSYYTGYRYGEREITLSIGISTAENTVEALGRKVHLLASVLDVSSPSKLVISDEPYKYYYAVPNGTISLEKLHRTGTAEITFLCHDPLGYGFDWGAFMPDSKGIFTVINYGTADAYPVVEVDFKNKACFFQATNPKGETVLIGRPKNATKPTVALTDNALTEDCTASSKFGSLAQSLLDSGRTVTGSYGVGLDGNGMVCTNYGTAIDNTWTGTAFKRNIGSNVQDFEVTFDIVFSSKGENYVAPPPAPPSPPPAPAPTPPPPAPALPEKPVTTTKPPAKSLGTWKVVNCGGLYINRDPNPNTPLYAMAPNTLIYPVESSGNWFKHTHSNKWNTFTGWSSKSYLQKVSDSGKSTYTDESMFSMDSRTYADEQMGIIEVYGFDQNGGKLFKAEIGDTNQYYEYVDPKVYIGNTLVLEDNKNAPSPRKIDIKDDNGKVTGQKEVASGVYGEFNDFVGQVTIRRERNSAGTQMWSCSVRKIENGIVVKEMKTTNSLSNSGFLKTDLNYLGFYIGRFGNNLPVSEVGVTNVKVKRLNMKTDQSIKDNVEIFDAGDHLQIDFKNGLVTLNSKSIMEQIDIGSDFFTLPSGRSQFAVKTDDSNAIVSCAIQERYL